jgi:WD40 repeat protein
MLLVADDVWTSGQLAPFVTAGRAGRLLVTTRRPAALVGAGARAVEVDAMPDQVAQRLLSRGLPQIPRRLEHDLLKLGGGWPLLLSLINGRLAEDLSRGGHLDMAAKDAAERLRRDGPVALDIKGAESRQLAVAATIDYSLYTLAAPDRDRFRQLGIFAEDAEIPLPLITAVWRAGDPAGMSNADADALCEQLDGLSLVSLAWAGDRKVLIIHDVIRDFVRSALGPKKVVELNVALLSAVAAGLPPIAAAQDGEPVAWWGLSMGDGYLPGYLIWHLIEAGRSPEAAALACDLRWAGVQLALSGPAAVAADLAGAGTPRAARMAMAVIQVAHLLAPAEPAEAVVDTLHSRLAADPDWGPQVAALRDTYHRLRLVNRWQLPDLPGPVQQAVLNGPDAVLSVCAVTVAGEQRLASAGRDRMVRIWDPATGTQQAVLDGHRGEVFAVCAVSVAGRELLASVGRDERDGSRGRDGILRIWDPAIGLRQAVIKGRHRNISAVCAVTVAGRALLVSAGFDGVVRIWDPATGAQQAVLTGHRDLILAVCAVNVAGREFLASAGNDGTVRIWDPATRAQRAVLEGHHQRTVRVLCAVSVAGRELLAGASDDYLVRIWDPATGAQQAVLKGHEDEVHAVCAVSVAGRELLAGASDDGTVRVWDPATGAQEAVLEGHRSEVRGVCAVTVAGYPRLASAGTDGTVRIWDPSAGPRQTVHGRRRWVHAVCAVSVGDRELLASAGGGGMVRIWDPATGAQQAVLEAHENTVCELCAVTVAGRELLASGTGNGMVRIWDLVTGAQLTVLDGHRGEVFAVCAVSVAGRELLASGGYDRTVRTWDPATGTQQVVLEGHRDEVHAVCAVNVAGRELLASASDDKTVRIWDPATGAQEAVLEGHRSGVHGVCAVTVAGHPRLASAGTDGTVRIWDPATGAQQAVLEGHRDEVLAVCAVSVAGRELLASAGRDGTLRIWDPATSQAEGLIRVENQLGACAQIGRGGLAAGGESGVYCFDVLSAVDPEQAHQTLPSQASGWL